MRRIWVLVILPVLLGQQPAEQDELDAKRKRDRALEVYRGEAARFEFYRDASRKERAELVPDPVYVWTNPVRNRGQDGAVFVWTCRGRAEVFGCFFSFPAKAAGQRGLSHEFHSLATTVIDVSRPVNCIWQPEAPGIDLKPIPGAPAPGSSATVRLAQMHALSRDFSVNTIDKANQRWDLRLLPHPLYRYQSTAPEVVDGAVFAFVTSAGTDPEVLLVLEARQPPGGGEPVWQFAFARFALQACFGRLKGKEVFTAADIPFNAAPSAMDARFRYTTYRDRLIPDFEETAP
jgi:hypothetical protein